MQSPKFPFSYEHLRKCINPDIAKHAWKNKILEQLRRQIIPDLIEFRDYKERIDYICREICHDIEQGKYISQTPRHYLIEKSRGLCRQMTIAAPRDMLLLQCLSNHLYSSIKRGQPNTKSYFEPGQAKFNKNRILISVEAYGAIAGWKRFQQAIFEFSKEREYILITDVANFYDYINFTHLRNIVSSICDTHESIIDFLIFILEGLSWRPDFMPRSGIGLPQMEAEAPRVLANAMLYELDQVADKHAFGDYVRFMDDIDVGVDTIAQAKSAVRDIDLTLQSRQLRLNANKTKILSTNNNEVSYHFCIRENKILDHCAEIIERNVSSIAAKKCLRKLYMGWRGPTLDSGRFFDGNGDKIFKRIVYLMHRCGLNIPHEDAEYIIKHHPTLRLVAFSALTRHEFPNRSLYRIGKLFYTDWFVDDASFIYMANFAVHAKFRKSDRLERVVKILIDYFIDSEKYFRIYAAIIMASKFLEPAELMSLVRRTINYWETDLWMARAVAGLFPAIMRDSQIASEFLALCRRRGNSEMLYVLDFHTNITSDVSIAKTQLSYAMHPNPSYPHGIFYPKALTILSISLNRGMTAAMKNILRRHGILMRDPYFARWFS